MTQGVKSHGAGIAIGDGASPESFTSLVEPTDIPALGGKSGLIDASNHDSVGYMDYVPKDLADGNEIKVQATILRMIVGWLLLMLLLPVSQSITLNTASVMVSTTFFLVGL